MKRGFTLIELMIVVAIIAIIAAIAIPSLVKSKAAANETSCIGSLKTLATAQETFKIRKVDEGNAGSFAQLKADGTLDMGLTQVDSENIDYNGKKSGYEYTLRPDKGAGNELDQPTWCCYTGTLSYKVDGQRRFFVNAAGVVRADDPELDEGTDDDPDDFADNDGATGSTWNPAG